jgi:hypothetical protein
MQMSLRNVKPFGHQKIHVPEKLELNNKFPHFVQGTLA